MLSGKAGGFSRTEWANGDDEKERAAFALPGHSSTPLARWSFSLTALWT